MTDQFPFAKHVANSFQDMTKSSFVFVTDINSETIYQEYLKAFPAGTDPVFKKTTEHDCACCRHFIRRVGNIITIDELNDAVHTIWDYAVKNAPYPYKEVAMRLRDVIITANISDLFCVKTNEISFGAEKTRSMSSDGIALSWNHFYTNRIPDHLRVASPDQVCGDYRTTVQVFVRGLTELTPSAVETVLALVEANNIYRGEEHKSALLQFKKAQQLFLTKSNEKERNIFAWVNAHGPAARFRNTVIGTLVQDISEGHEVEQAVQSYENKVAPTNYKRTSAIITPGMVKKAMETIVALGLEPALERRFAVIDDISINDVKWADGAAKPLMKGGIGEMLMQAAVKNHEEDEKRAEEISLDYFMMNILPETVSLNILFQGRHLGNLVSLTAPVCSEPKQLFRWNNDFAWSYTGNVADSIAERVKKAGGKVAGALLRISLSWFNYDDLDLHIYEPQGRGSAGLRDHIFFANKRGWTDGELDVDMNAGGGRSREAVENVVWMKKIPDGDYRIVVNNYCKRESVDVGFVVEVESNSKLSHFSYNKAVRDRQDVLVATLHVKNGNVEIEIGDPAITTSNLTQEKWGLKTERYEKVNVVTLSPNYWGENAVGNKHAFFMLDKAKNDESTRGIYNEFLHPRLEAHRKVFEVIGDKTKCRPTDEQLSGLGFSSTKRDSFVVRVAQGNKQRLFNVKVG